MFLASTRCALIACRYLTQGYEEHRYMSASEIADHYKMNARALMPALRRLVQQGLLRSRRGSADSGFMFARSPQEITLWEIVHTLEGELILPCCMSVLGDVQCDCGSNKQCKVNSIFNDGFRQIRNELQKIDLSSYATL